MGREPRPVQITSAEMKLNMRTYSLDNLTMVGVELPELVDIAAATGFGAIAPWAMAMENGAMTVLPDSAKVTEMAARLRATGVKLAAGDGFALMPGHDIEAYKTSATVMADLGAKNIVVLQFDNERERAFDGFCQLSEHAGSLGMGVALEFFVTSQVKTLNDAVAFLARTGLNNVGLQVDFFHIMNGAGSVEELAAIDPALIRCAQISDGKLGLTVEEYAHGMMADRAVPGEGEFPLADLLAVLPADINVGVEIPRSPLPQTTQERETYARQLRAALDRFL